MKTREEILATVKGGRKSACEMIDSRDYSRLSEFFPADQWECFGFKLKDDAPPYVPKDFTLENVLAQLKEDVAFGFKKALNQRGISSWMMYETVKMWMWVLGDPLEEFDNYAQYGLPLFKAVALKYGFDNPIGDDAGNETKYEES